MPAEIMVNVKPGTTNPHLIMATCLLNSALLVAELGSCLHPKRASVVGPYPGKCL